MAEASSESSSGNRAPRVAADAPCASRSRRAVTDAPAPCDSVGRLQPAYLRLREIALDPGAKAEPEHRPHDRMSAERSHAELPQHHRREAFRNLVQRGHDKGEDDHCDKKDGCADQRRIPRAKLIHQAITDAP